MLLLVSCAPPPDQITWSPDGRYVAFNRPGDGKPWLWDTRKNKARKIGDQSVSAMRYLPSGELLAVVPQEIQTPKPEKWTDFDLLSVRSGKLSPLYQHAPENCSLNLSSDGQTLYYIATETKEKKEASHLWRKDLSRERDPARDVFSIEGHFNTPVPDESGSRVLLSVENGLGILDVTKGAVEMAIRPDPSHGVGDARWLSGERTILCQQVSQGSIEGDLTDLCVYSLDSKTSRTLQRNLIPTFPTVLSPDRRWLAATILESGGAMNYENYGDAPPTMMQLALINVATGEEKIVTDEIMGAGYPAFDPKGKKIAYFSPPVGGFLHILDLKSTERTNVACDGEEAEFLAAEKLVRRGERKKAIEAFNRFQHHFPETRLKDFALYQLTALCLDPQINQVDEAFETARKINEDDQPWAENLFWRREDLIARDPARDWMVRYQSKTSGDNGDLARDLLGVWARVSESKILLRIDYNGSTDLDGSQFQDTIVLFDEDLTTRGCHSITPSTEWEHGAERTLIYREWGNSRYDVELLDAAGKTSSRILVEGQSQLKTDPLDIEVLKPRDGSHGSIMLAIPLYPHNATGNPPKIGIQVCTIKGGSNETLTDEIREKELLRIQKTTDGKPVCDVADAFGAENTPERIEADLRAGKPPIIRGYAGFITLPAPPPPPPAPPAHPEKPLASATTN